MDQISVKGIFNSDTVNFKQAHALLATSFAWVSD